MKTRRKAVRTLAYNTWRREWRAANPGATKEQRKEAWAAVRAAEVRKARLTMKALEKGGFRVIPAKAG
ncbi:hypothetical protein [Sinisalibacter aestuarii]|nr:hypothetical protein [Sinisalibacter aestuarii]